MSQHKKNSPNKLAAKTNLDDWDTDPDYERQMNEMEQRWGNKRTVGSINMSELIDEVRRDHKVLRERFDHPSQRDYSEGFGGKFGIQHDRKDLSAHDYDHLEKLSKHSSQEISHKVITSTTTSSSIIKSGLVSDTKRTLLEKSNEERKYLSGGRNSPVQARQHPKEFSSPSSVTKSPEEDFEKISSSRRSVKEDKTSSKSTNEPDDLQPALKSIQEKIDAFKKQFEDLRSEVASKSEQPSKPAKVKSYERDSASYLNRNPARETTTSPTKESRAPDLSSELPKSSIKSLSEKFETLGREENENFRKRTEARRREFFDQIKTQVGETRKDYDDFDPIDLDHDPTDELERRLREKLEGLKTSPKSSPTSMSGARASPQSPSNASSSAAATRRQDGNESNLSSGSLMSRPKVYTHRETTEERIISKIVKENDKIIQNETKRDVERSSSHHGSSDEDDAGPRSIKLSERDLRASSSSQTHSQKHQVSLSPATKSPIQELDTRSSGLMARTIFDYQAAESDELSFDVDDLITNIEKIDPGWYKGTITYRNGQKQVGLFPANYVKLLNDTGEY